MDCRTSKRSLISLEAIVHHYIDYKRKPAQRELRYYAIQRTLADAIREAALSRLPSGKRHSHQRKIPSQVLKNAEKRLQAAADRVRQADSFDRLHDLIGSKIRSIKGIGPLAVYDISHRIGAWLKLEPKYIYLHAGTRIGARAFGFGGKKIDPSLFPKPFKQLNAAEIEDCLCLYKDNLRRLRKIAKRRY